MAAFRRGERVRIRESNSSDKVYCIKKFKPARNGGMLYLLKSLEEHPVYRLIHEDEMFFLERIY